jgi:hypothetical protein
VRSGGQPCGLVTQQPCGLVTQPCGLVIKSGFLSGPAQIAKREKVFTAALIKKRMKNDVHRDGVAINPVLNRLKLCAGIRKIGEVKARFGNQIPAEEKIDWIFLNLRNKRIAADSVCALKIHSVDVQPAHHQPGNTVYLPVGVFSP